MKDLQALTTQTPKREFENVGLEMRNLKTGKNTNLDGNPDGVLAAEERLEHERSGHASFGSRCETCIRVRGKS